MIEPHHIAAAGTVASGTITTIAAMESPDWRVVAVNAGITLLSGLVSKWLQSRKAKGVKK